MDEYADSFLIDTFLEQAIYLKAEPKKALKSRDHGLVNILDGANFLYAYASSYKEFISCKIRKEFYNRSIIDSKRINKAVRQAIVAQLPNVVKTEAASFAIAISPNNFTPIDETFLNKEWRDNAFKIFKKDIVEIDRKTEEDVIIS